MASRSYIVDLPGGTATQTVQIQAKSTLRRAILSSVNAAVGKTEISTSSASQIGTAQPTGVVARFNHSATAGQNNEVVEFVLPVTAFQSVYVHQTGAGNIGTMTLITA